jgi:hypothetical protein
MINADGITWAMINSYSLGGDQIRRPSYWMIQISS